MKKIAFLFFVLLHPLNSHAAVTRMARDIKLPTQVLMHKQSFTDPVVADTTGVMTANAGPTSTAAFTISTGLNSPTVPRNIIVTPSGTTADVDACNLTVYGTNIYGASISESFNFAIGASTGLTGSKAFKTITSISFPANCEKGTFAAQWSIGQGEKLGLDRCMANAGDLVFSTVAGAYESTRATVAVNASSVESNTMDFNGTMNGSNDFNAYYVENFGCAP